MKVGSLVELVKDDFTGINGAIYFPKKGVVYTIRDFVKWPENRYGLLLQEVTNPKIFYYRYGFAAEPSWKPERFRELLPPIANIEDHINENTLEPVYI